MKKLVFAFVVALAAMVASCTRDYSGSYTLTQMKGDIQGVTPEMFQSIADESVGNIATIAKTEDGYDLTATIAGKTESIHFAKDEESGKYTAMMGTMTLEFSDGKAVLQIEAPRNSMTCYFEKNK